MESHLKKLIFIHGLESSPQGIKAQEIRRVYPDALIPEFTRNVEERLQLLDSLIHEPFYIVGSSLGGLTAIAFAVQHPELVRGMLLLAPAVGLFSYEGIDDQKRVFMETISIPPSIKTYIMASERDQIIPYDAILRLMDNSSGHPRLELFKLDDDHSLNQHLDVMMSLIDLLMQEEPSLV